MLVRCLDSSFSLCGSHPDLVRFLGVETSSLQEKRFPMVPGEQYLVAALAFGPFVPWYFVLDRFHGSRVPIPVPCLVFSVQQSRPSRLWQMGTWVDRFDQVHGLLAPRDWAIDPLFHGKMFEGDEEALRLMDEAASEMLREAPVPWITSRAVAVGEGTWVADEQWNETWEASPKDAMTVSPKTGNWFHNPVYVSDGR
jgi:hypothetical protein